MAGDAELRNYREAALGLNLSTRSVFFMYAYRPMQDYPEGEILTIEELLKVLGPLVNRVHWRGHVLRIEEDKTVVLDETRIPASVMEELVRKWQ
jgi:hypothetical protein